MIDLVVLALAAGLQTAANPPSVPSDEAGVSDRMVALYDNICLQKFPDDAAVSVAAVAAGGVAMTPEQVAIYLHEDPGIGWRIKDGAHYFVVTVEKPPFHACSVRRWTAAGMPDLTSYQAAASRYEAAHPGLTLMAPADLNVGGVTSHVTGERGHFADRDEALYVFSNAPATEGPGTTVGTEVRFVHQMVSRGDKTS